MDLMFRSAVLSEAKELIPFVKKRPSASPQDDKKGDRMTKRIRMTKKGKFILLSAILEIDDNDDNNDKI